MPDNFANLHPLMADFENAKRVARPGQQWRQSRDTPRLTCGSKTHHHPRSVASAQSNPLAHAVITYASIAQPGRQANKASPQRRAYGNILSYCRKQTHICLLARRDVSVLDFTRRSLHVLRLCWHMAAFYDAINLVAPRPSGMLVSVSGNCRVNDDASGPAISLHGNNNPRLAFLEQR